MKLIYYPNKMLLTKAEPVEAVDGEINKLMDDLLQLAIDKNGYGLAANQVGILKRVLVATFEDEIVALANPEIVEFLGGEENMPEGCLSFASAGCIIRRHTGVKVKGLGRNNKEVELIFHGGMAQILQHEVDHLDGITIAQRAGTYNRRKLLSSYKKTVRQIKKHPPIKVVSGD